MEKGTGGPGSPAEVPVRFLALTIDGILVGAMWVVISLVASALRGAPVLGILAWVVLALAGALVSVGYLPYSYARYQATVGKSLMGVKVVDEISGGRESRSSRTNRPSGRQRSSWPNPWRPAPTSRASTTVP